MPYEDAHEGDPRAREEAGKLWQAVLDRLELEINDPHTFGIWLRPTCGVAIDDGRLVVAVPNHVFLEWINDNYAEQAERAAEMPVLFEVRQ